MAHFVGNSCISGFSGFSGISCISGILAFLVNFEFERNRHFLAPFKNGIFRGSVIQVEKWIFADFGL